MATPAKQAKPKPAKAKQTLLSTDKEGNVLEQVNVAMAPNPVIAEPVANIAVQSQAQDGEIIQQDEDDEPLFDTVEPATIEQQKEATNKLAQVVQVGMNEADLNSYLNRIQSATVSFKDDITICAALCILHAIKHGRVGPARKLIQALGAKAVGNSFTPFKTNALKDWFLEFGPFKKAKAQVTDYQTGKKDEGTTIVLDPDLRREMEKLHKKNPLKFATSLVVTPFFKWKSESANGWGGFDFEKELERLFKRAREANSKHKDDPKLKLGTYLAVYTAHVQAAKEVKVLENKPAEQDNKPEETKQPEEVKQAA